MVRCTLRFIPPLQRPVRHSNEPCRCSETLVFFNQHGLPHSFASREFFSVTVMLTKIKNPKMHEFDGSICKQRAHTISLPPQLVKMTWLEMLLRTERQRWHQDTCMAPEGSLPKLDDLHNCAPVKRMLTGFDPIRQRSRTAIFHFR